MTHSANSNSDRRPRIALVGAGVVGQTLARRLREKGYPIGAVYRRNTQRAREAVDFIGAGTVCEDLLHAPREAEVLLITTPDEAIQHTAAHLGRLGVLPSGSLVLHCSGALGREALAAACARNVLTAAMHPLQTFPTPELALERLPGTYFFYEAEPEAEALVRQLIADLEGKAVPLPSASRGLYHAAAVVACNYLVTLQAHALQLLEAAGISEEVAREALHPLVSATLENVRKAGPVRALTGPVARGDMETIIRHLQETRKVSRESSALYAFLGDLTTDVALEKGTLTPAQAERLREWFLERGPFSLHRRPHRGRRKKHSGGR